MLGFEIDRDVIYFFSRYPSLVLLRLIVNFSMFSLLSFVARFSRAENFAKVQTWYWTLQDSRTKKIVKKLTGFNLLSFYLFPPLWFVLKSECKGRHFSPFLQIFFKLFFDTFLSFLTHLVTYQCFKGWKFLCRKTCF